MDALNAKINAVEDRLGVNRDELWKVTERKRKLTAELIKLRERLFNKIREEE